ncbi:MAG: NAD(P)/FAD-dependent oxidoreductase [Acidimicrobiales bacterium]|nr:NAD(P)/FAD-dependent oxidoreductase [Acidimicrobiales bacterium]
MQSHKFIIIGAGMAGIVAAIKLKEAGFDSIEILEKADSLGGTWRENTYPGVACDVPSHLYSYSFELNPNWSHVFSPGSEILNYFKEISKKYEVDDLIKYNQEVTSAHFNGNEWEVKTSSGYAISAEYLIGATGVLHHPKYPDIKGIESFKGAMFHSSRWDHEIDLAPLRVGVIGSGSTGVQIVSELSTRVKSLTLFQRTPQWIFPQFNPEYSPHDIEAFTSDPKKMQEHRELMATVFTEGFSNAVVDADSPQMKAIEETCLQNLESSIKDPELKEMLRPNYRAACKRLVISGAFYEAMNRPNVNLECGGIKEIVENGVKLEDGSVVELDVLVLATGFKADVFLRPMEVSTCEGKSLDMAWKSRPEAYLAETVPGFPNLFLLNGPNGPVGNFSLIDVAELQVDYLLKLISHIDSNGFKKVMPTQAALEEFEAQRVEAAKKTVWVTGCRSWYLDDRGIPAAWPWPFDRFRQVMSEPDYSAFTFS